MIQQFHSQVYAQDREKHVHTKKLAHECSQQYYSQNFKKPKCPSIDEWKNKTKTKEMPGTTNYFRIYETFFKKSRIIKLHSTV